MGEQSLYVFPSFEKDSRGFCSLAVPRLIAAGVLERGPIEHLAELWCGAEARNIVPGGFESAGLRVVDRPQLIPEDPAVAPRCPGCGADVSDRYYEAIDADAPESVDWSEVVVQCDCGLAPRLTELVDPAGIHARSEFFFLEHVSCTEAAVPEVVARLRNLLAPVDISVRLYWYT